MSSSPDLLNADNLHEELRQACSKDPSLRPLLPIVDRQGKGTPLSKFDLLNLLIHHIRSDPKLDTTYHAAVPSQIHALATAHAAPQNDHTNDKIRLLGDFALPASPKMTALMNFFHIHKQPSENVFEGDGEPMWCLQGQPFQNWGETVSNTPALTFVARTVAGICNLVKWAKVEGKTVRLAGYRHTWNDLFSADNEILLMLLPLNVTTVLPSSEPAIDPNSELQGISVVPFENGGLAHIKAGTTNEQFRRWCLQSKAFCIPFNVIMVEITFGGSNAPICHGSGFKTTTLSDLVAEVEYVDANGVVQIVSDPEELKAAAGAFGLLGVVTSLKLRIDKMQQAVMQPVKMPIGLAIPPPEGYTVPKQIDMTGITAQQLAQARKDFEKRCETKDYLEWFWWPYQKEVWVNCWSKVDVGTAKLEPFPSTLDANIQWLEGALAELIVYWEPFQALPGRLQAYFLGFISLSQMLDIQEPSESIHTYVSEAIHFRRGIQNFRCSDSEWEIPIPAVKGTKTRDYEAISRAWWDAISAFYNRPDAPMRLTLEMRLTGSSEVLLAPQRGNTLGTISIEVLTTLNTPRDQWLSFMQDVTDAWTGYVDADGGPLKCRPHWAKQWQGLHVRGKPIVQYLREEAYVEEIPEFMHRLNAIATKRGTTLEDMQARFGNALLTRLVL